MKFIRLFHHVVHCTTSRLPKSWLTNEYFFWIILLIFNWQDTCSSKHFEIVWDVGNFCGTVQNIRISKENIVSLIWNQAVFRFIDVFQVFNFFSWFSFATENFVIAPWGMLCIRQIGQPIPNFNRWFTVKLLLWKLSN